VVLSCHACVSFYETSTYMGSVSLMQLLLQLHHGPRAA